MVAVRKPGPHNGGGQVGTLQSTLRPPEVHMFYRKIEICIVYMGVGHVRTACCLIKNNCLTCSAVTFTSRQNAQ